MKKFSVISNINAPAEQKELKPVEINEQDKCFEEISALMDMYLKVELHSVKPFQIDALLEGKEAFILALLSFMEKKNSKDKISLLEALKFDSSFNNINEKIDNLKKTYDDLNGIMKVEKIISTYTDDNSFTEYINLKYNSANDITLRKRLDNIDEMLKLEKYNQKILLLFKEILERKKLD